MNVRAVTPLVPAAGKRGFWTCQRITAGQRCKQVNPKRLQKCGRCGKRRPATKQPAHRAVLAEMDYAACVALFGKQCGICGRKPSPRRKLDRDHEHRDGGKIRGLLCARCNRALPNWVTAEWLRAAAVYLERSALEHC